MAACAWRVERSWSPAGALLTPPRDARSTPDRARRGVVKYPLGETSLGKQPRQFAGLVCEPDEIVGTTDMSLADDDLRERVSAKAVAQHGAHPVDVVGGSNLVDRGPETAQAPPGTKECALGFV